MGFLTVFPVNSDLPLTETSKYAFTFPLVGCLIGGVTGLSCYLLKDLLPDLIVGTIGLGLILLMTGLHHTDGLLDFGDGLMYHGTASQKIKVMKDNSIGTGGLVLGFIVLMATLFSISHLQKHSIISSIVIAETGAKLALVLSIWIARPIGKGIGKVFIDSFKIHSGRSQVLASVAIGLVVAVLVGGLRGVTSIASVFVISPLIVNISMREFNGVNGDVLGAINEIARLTSLTMFLVL